MTGPRHIGDIAAEIVKQVAKKRQHNNPTRKPRADRADTEAKTRLCLKCRKIFSSEWAGERVCRPCKLSNAWREGRAAEYYGMGRP